MGLFDFGKKKKEKAEQSLYGDGNSTDPKEALQYLLHVGLHGSFLVEDEVHDNRLYLPKWQLSIMPQVQQLTENSAVLGFYVTHPNWGRPMYECCASMGSDTKTAIGMASGSFLFCFMQGLGQLLQKENPKILETSYAGKDHRFHAYVSDVVGMGEEVKCDDVQVYWKLLEEDIKKRMGNQRFCYVKIYGSKVNGKVIGECRINDVQSDELSAKVATLVEKWNVSGFASQKQFFFIEQDAATIQPYPYWGEKGEKELIGKVLKAVQLFCASDTKEAFDSLQERLEEQLQDVTLATECRLFLPEMCAEDAGRQREVKFSDAVDFLMPNQEKVTVYKHQLTDYYEIENALFTAFGQGIFGEETNAIYQSLVGTSAICDVLGKAMEGGSKLEDLQLTSLLYSVDERFELR